MVGNYDAYSPSCSKLYIERGTELIIVQFSVQCL
jgi:hypothetical protein